MDLLELHQYAEDNDIPVEYEWLHNHGVSIEDEEGYSICLNKQLIISSEIQEKIALAHELGHYATGTVYTAEISEYDLKSDERRAWMWVYKKLVPEKKILRAVRKGVYEVWELADYFNVPDWLMYYAVCCYKGISTDIYYHEASIDVF